jgi:hypothetical protein
MKPSTQDDSFARESARAGEDTLRLIATLPSPTGLEDRVRTRLESAPRTGRVLFWPASYAGGGGWARGSTVRAAAAAAIVFVVAGGGWGVYSRVQPVTQPRVIVMPPRVNGAGGFSSAGAMRTPQTLNGPVVTRQADEAPAQADDKASGAAPGGTPATKKSHRAKATSSKQPAVQSAAR